MPLDIEFFKRSYWPTSKCSSCNRKRQLFYPMVEGHTAINYGLCSQCLTGKMGFRETRFVLEGGVFKNGKRKHYPTPLDLGVSETDIEALQRQEL